MINREDFNGKKYEEMAAAMQVELDNYKITVDGFTTTDECAAEEQVLMASMKEVEERLNNVVYTLPDSVEYNGKTYSRKNVAEKVNYFLNKIECKWEQTLGLYQLVSLWRGEDFKEISYRVYDSTLRCLNQVTFKGYTEWTDILIVNDYLSQCHNEYSLDTGLLLYLSECHNVLLNKMKELSPQDNTIPESM